MIVCATSPNKRTSTTDRVKWLKMQAESSIDEITLAALLRVLSGGGILSMKPFGRKKLVIRYPKIQEETT